MSLNFGKIDIDTRIDQVIDDKQKDTLESITHLEKPKKKTSKKLGGAEAAMAASEELAELCSMLDEFEEVPKKKTSKKLWGAEAAMAASEELAELCSTFDE